jgi:lysozyme family protein
MASLDVFKNSALPLVLIFEGAYSNDKNDRGGATYKGITTAEYIEYREHCGLLTQPVQMMTDDEMFDIYLKSYWMAGHCPSLPDMLAIACFDTSVNNGPGRSAILLQRAASVPVDGIIGPMTLKAISIIPEQDLLDGYLMARDAFYDRIVAHDPTQQKFYAGWMRRLEFLTRFVKGLKTLEQLKTEW